MISDRKTVDIVVRGGAAVTLDADNTVIGDGTIAIDNGRIVWIGASQDPMAAGFRGTSEIDARGRVVMPGLVDAHFHTAQQLLRGKLAEIGRTRPPKQPVWKHYYLPFEAMLTPKDVHLSALLAYTNMLMVGTTCFADAGGPHPDAMAEAADIVGIRGFVAQSTMDRGNAPGDMVVSTKEAHERNIALVKRWKDHRRVNAFLSLRQILVCSSDLIQAIGQSAKDLDTRIHTHLAEGTYEVDYALEQFGERPAEYLDRLGVLTHRLHCAHSVLLSPNEVDLYALRGASACHCGFHNYALGVPRVVEMWRRGIPIGLGTDGAASSSTLDLFQVAHVTRVGQQAVAGTPWNIRGPIGAEDLLKMASHGGARALGIGHDTGFLAVDARADLVIADISGLDQFPDTDPLFVAANTVVGRDVRTVIVDGRVVVMDREPQFVDVERLRHDLAALRPDIMTRFDAALA